MSNLIGSVKFNSSIDGDRMPRDAEKAGQKAGAAGAKGYDKKWSEGFEKTLARADQHSIQVMRKSGAKGGKVYGDRFNASFRKFVLKAQEDFNNLRMDPRFIDDLNRKFDSAATTVAHLRKQVDLMNGTVSSSAYRNASRQIDEWARAHNVAAADVDAAERRIDSANIRANKSTLDRVDSMRKLNDALDDLMRKRRAQERGLASLDAAMKRLGARLDAQGAKWRDLSAGARRWILIISAIAAAGEDIAVLGSAAGAGLIALGGGIAALGVGAVGLIAVFKNLTQKIMDAPPAMRPTILEFRNFTRAVGDMNDVVAMSAFKNMGGAFDKLRNTLRGLTPAMALMGATIGDLVNDMANNLTPGREAFKQIQTLAANSSPLFDKMVRSTGTLGIALIRAFNRANPLVSDMVNWIDTLIQRFDKFTRSNGFDQWMRNAKTVFGSLGPLLDATGRALNDLVTPESVRRTADFLDRLTSFMPNLQRMLTALGSLDIFGVLAAALDNVGKGLEPILPALTELGNVLRDRLLVFLDAFGAALGVAAQATTPLVEVITGLLNAMPAPLIQAIAVAVTALGTAFLGLKIARTIESISGAVTKSFDGINRYILNMGGVGNAMSALPSRGAALLGKAGLFGMIAAAAVSAGFALADFYRQVSGLNDIIADATATGQKITTTYQQVQKSFDWTKAIGAGATNVKDFGAALDYAGQVQANFFTTFQSVWNPVTRGYDAFRQTLTDVGDSLAGLVSSDLPTAQEQFAKYADQLGATDAQTLTMINSSGKFKDALEEVIRSHQMAVTNENLLAAARGEGAFATDVYTAATQGATRALDFNNIALDQMAGKAITATGEIDGLADAIRNFGSKTLDAREANRQFEAAVDDATETLKQNGKTLNDTTKEGRANEAALDAIAKAALQSAAANYEQSGSQEQATDRIKKGRDALIEQLGKFGIVGKAAEEYADKLGLIPENIATIVKADTSGAQSAVDRFITRNQGRSITFFTKTGTKNATAMASGGTLYGPRHILAGEAGPEAIVPLNRPLNQVDPSVRWLSAIAQGKPAMASGGVDGGGRQVTVEPGAIVVEDRSGDSNRTANEVVRRLVERVAG